MDSKEAWICVRPLHVELSSPTDGLVRGIVQQTAYLGGEFRVYVRVQDMDVPMTAIVPSGSAVPQVGEHIGLRFDPDRCMAVFDIIVPDDCVFKFLH